MEQEQEQAMIALGLRDYIKANYSSIKAFADAQCVAKQQVNTWLIKDTVVINHKLYGVRRVLNEPT